MRHFEMYQISALPVNSNTAIAALPTVPDYPPPKPDIDPSSSVFLETGS